MRRLLAALVLLAAATGPAACGDDAPATSPDGADTAGASAGAASGGSGDSTGRGRGVLTGSLVLLAS